MPSLRLLLLPAVLLLSACQIIPPATPDPTRFYVLDAAAIATTKEFVPPEHQVRLHLHALELPTYLTQSRELLVRRGTHELVPWNGHRWAEGIDAGVSRLLARRLAASAKVAGVATPPFDGTTGRDLDLFVRLERAEGQRTATGHVAVVVLGYRAVQPDGTVVAQGELAPPPVAWDGDSPAALVAALSQAVLQAGHALVAALPLRE
jgi:uncharacterized lipoprotein YmbA